MPMAGFPAQSASVWIPGFNPCIFRIFDGIKMIHALPFPRSRTHPIFGLTLGSGSL
jgi:hypothetical protein